MIRINLVPREEARRQKARSFARRTSLLVGVGLALLIGVAEVVTRARAAAVDGEMANFREEMAILNERHQQAVLLERKRRALESKVRTIELLEEQRSGPARVLDHLGAATPEKLWLTELRTTGGSARLSGRAIDNQTIAAFMRELEASPQFSGVDLVETRQVEEDGAKFKEFQIAAEVLWAAPVAPAAGGAGDAAGDAASRRGTETAPAAAPAVAPVAPAGGAS